MRKAKKDAIRSKVSNLLQEFGVAGPPVPVVDIVEWLGAKVRYSPFDGELAGMLVRGEEETVIGVNSLHHINRQRFTIAHECGHLVLHKGDVHIDRSFRVNRRDSKSSQAIDLEEIEANRFAAELLMPYEMLLEGLFEYDIDVEDEDQIKKLARSYNVSVQAMTHRVTNLFQDLF